MLRCDDLACEKDQPTTKIPEYKPRQKEESEEEVSV